MTYLEEPESAIAKLHRCGVEPVETAPVEVFLGEKPAWTGNVTVVEATGEPKAKRRNAWGFPSEVGALEAIANLGIPPVDSPEMAVRFAIASQPRGYLSA